MTELVNTITEPVEINDVEEILSTEEMSEMIKNTMQHLEEGEGGNRQGLWSSF